MPVVIPGPDKPLTGIAASAIKRRRANAGLVGRGGG